MEPIRLDAEMERKIERRIFENWNRLDSHARDQKAADVARECVELFHLTLDQFGTIKSNDEAVEATTLYNFLATSCALLGLPEQYNLLEDAREKLLAALKK